MYQDVKEMYNYYVAWVEKIHKKYPDGSNWPRNTSAELMEMADMCAGMSALSAQHFYTLIRPYGQPQDANRRITEFFNRVKQRVLENIEQREKEIEQIMLLENMEPKTGFDA